MRLFAFTRLAADAMFRQQQLASNGNMTSFAVPLPAFLSPVVHADWLIRIESSSQPEEP